MNEILAVIMVAFVITIAILILRGNNKKIERNNKEEDMEVITNE